MISKHIISKEVCLRVILRRPRKTCKIEGPLTRRNLCNLRTGSTAWKIVKRKPYGKTSETLRSSWSDAVFPSFKTQMKWMTMQLTITSKTIKSILRQGMIISLATKATIWWTGVITSPIKSKCLYTSENNQSWLKIQLPRNCKWGTQKSKITKTSSTMICSQMSIQRSKFLLRNDHLQFWITRKKNKSSQERMVFVIWPPSRKSLSYLTWCECVKSSWLLAKLRCNKATQ